jgi:hypothetical protein
MKINGKTAGLNFVVHYIDRPGQEPLSVRLQALPVGFNDAMSADLPEPAAPVEFAKGADGKVLRDELGLAIRVERKGDAGYRAACERIRTLRMYWQLVKALEGDAGVTFEAQWDKYGNRREWLEAIEGELREFGLSDGEIYVMAGKIAALNHGHVARVTGHAESFLPETPGAGDGACRMTRDGASGT